MDAESKSIPIEYRLTRKFGIDGNARVIGSLILALLLVISGQIWIGESISATIPLTLDKSSASEDSLNDGPHVHWQNDSSSIVFYLCEGVVLKDTFSCIDTLRFRGFCADACFEYIIPLESHTIKPHVFDNASKIMAVSDVHGEYESLVEILTNGGVIDDQCRWTWGDGHLVILGDIFDRGDRVTECLWLIYRLEMEAERAGGYVHFVLGNHELMVLRGDNRYVHERYLNGIVKRTKIRHEDLYGPDMELGRWLRSKHTTVEINDIVFVHAGLSPLLLSRNLTLKDLNEVVRDNIDLRSSQLAFNESVEFLFGGEGPLWYRGYHYQMEGRYPQATQSAVDSILTYYGADVLVVGHTEVDQVSALYDGRVMAIDVPVEELGNLQALLWKEGRFYRITGQGKLQPLK